MPEPAIIGFAAYSGTGKTTLLEKLIPLIKERGLNVGLIKASHHSVELDQPGKDSYRLRQAGTDQLVLSTPERSICFTEHRNTSEPVLEDQLNLLNLNSLDLVLVEGFRDAVFPKIELYRQALNKPFLFKQDNHIIAVASDRPIPDLPKNLAPLNINDTKQIASFILTRFF